MSVLCLGEALVDLVCERPVASLAEADAFVPHFGGAIANVAVVAARAGAEVSLAGGVGDDAWGDWLRARLAAEGVGLEWFIQRPGVTTPIAFVVLDDDGEPTYQIYGEGIGDSIVALGDRLEEAVEASSGLFVSSNTLVGEPERELTLRAREQALARDLPVIVDANLRLHRWRTAAEAAAETRALVPGALLVRCNTAEGRALTGEPEPEAAAASLLAMGARLAVVSRGAKGAILRGAFKADVPGVRAEPKSAIGAGDVLTGTLLAALARTGYYPASVAATLPDAVAAAARATERWSAV